jgi:hypothetical protein
MHSSMPNYPKSLPLKTVSLAYTQKAFSVTIFFLCIRLTLHCTGGTLIRDAWQPGTWKECNLRAWPIGVGALDPGLLSNWVACGRHP